MSITFDVLLLTAILYSATWLLRRFGSSRVVRAAKAAFLLSLILPLMTLRALAYSVQRDVFAVVGVLASSVSVAVVLAASVLLCFGAGHALYRGARAVVLALSPLFFLTAGQLAWSTVSGPWDSSFAPKALAPVVSRPAGLRTRVVWLVFDEMDQRLAFVARPSTLRLPELDRFRSQAVYAVNAYPPSDATQTSLPSLLSGELISQAGPGRSDELMITLKGSGRTVGWSAHPSIFSRARSMGLNAAIAGWHHPYCRLFHGSVTSCFSEPCVDAVPALEKAYYAEKLGVFRSMLFLAQEQLKILPWVSRMWPEDSRQRESLLRLQRVVDYKEIERHALQLATDPKLGLVVTHWPVPHPPGIYDAARDQLTASGPSNYLDNLRLVDRTLRVLRHHMQEAGLWNKTDILLTSDHEYRTPVWTNSFYRNREEEIALHGRDTRVPFLLKLSNQTEGALYEKSFMNLLAHDLTLALLRGEVSTPEMVAAWLDRRR